MLIVHQGNRAERLADALAEVLETPLASPLAPEMVAVQSIGMARWLTLRLSHRLGIAANLQFPFPATLLWRLFRAALSEVPEQSPYRLEVLTWRVLSQLSDGAEGPGFEELAAYLRSCDGLGAYGLAEQIALRFDEYMIYRPEWILAWEQGAAGHWQARLWRRLTAGAAPRHRVRLAGEFAARLTSGAADASLPERISLFGVTAMPPPHLELFAEIGKRIEVHLFLLNPCQEYWGEIRDRRAIDRRAGGRDPEALRLEVGNSLLASLGGGSRDLFDRLQDLETAEETRFEEPGEACLLHAVQSDLLHLRNRGDGDDPPTLLDVADRSIRVHSCHSPVREIEVLHDQLLALFEADPTLTPADVAVLTPNLDRYAPIVEAVFGTAEASRRIPFQVAGRGAPSGRSVTRAVFDLLALPEGRADVNQLLALLEVEAVRRRFGLAQGDLDLIRDWLRAAGVRWGVDADDRAARQLPAVPDHTWRAGLDRLLLGYALPGGGTRCFAGILPLDAVEGEAAAVLGRLAEYAEALFRARAELADPRTVPAWAERLVRLVEDFLLPGEREETECRRLLAAIARLADEAAQAEFTGPVGLPVVRVALQRLVEAEGRRPPLGEGAVTVAGLVPARGIPFAVVCLVGLEDGAFPRPQPTTGFDLMREAPRSGDRSVRQDDRALFLEALLAGRRVLSLSYVGQHIRENSRLPPSAPLAELLDYCDRGFALPDGRPVREWLETRHPLQPFSPRYFSGDARLVSFAAEHCEASRSAAAPRSTHPPFLQDELPEPPAEWRRVELAQFLRFFDHPARHLARERLGIRLEEDEGPLEAREPFVLDPLGEHQIRRDWLDGALQGRPADDTAAALRAGGLLPHGRVGEVLLARAARRAEGFARQVAAQRPLETRPPVAVDLEVGPLRLSGHLGELSARGRFVYRCGKIRVKDRLRLWIAHLLLTRVAPPDLAPESRLLAEDGAIRFGPVAGAEAELRTLAELYWAGSRRVLPLFPESSYAFASSLHRGGNRASAFTKARDAWRENAFSGRGEETDPYHRLVVRSADPIDEAFAALAEAVFLPLLSAQAEA